MLFFQEEVHIIHDRQKKFMPDVLVTWKIHDMGHPTYKKSELILPSRLEKKKHVKIYQETFNLHGNT